MDIVQYAAFGSNLHPLRLRARTSSARLAGTAYLSDWSLRFHKRSVDNSGKCSIHEGSSGLYVAVYQMSAADKQELDRIEGVGSGYTNGRIIVPKFGECATYLAAETHIDESLIPYDWYRELVLLGCRELGFATDYVHEIERLAVTQDPDPKRRDDNWKIVRELRDSPTHRVN